MSAIEKAKVREQDEKALLAKAVKEALISAVNKAESTKNANFAEIAEAFIRTEINRKVSGVKNIRVIHAKTDWAFAEAEVEITSGNTMYKVIVTASLSWKKVVYAEVNKYRLVDYMVEKA